MFVRLTTLILTLAISVTFLGETSFAQSEKNSARRIQKRAPAAARDDWKARLNENTVTIISGNPNGGFLYTAYDMSAVLDKGDELRVLPIVGKGGAQNVRDVLFLRGIDMGIIHPHIVKYFDETGELGRNIKQRVAYIARLFPDELHVVARGDIKSFADLEGKRVNFSDAGSGTQLSMRIIFKALGMNVNEFNMGQADAFELMRKGELDATTCTCVKPLRSVRALKPEWGFKLLPVAYAKPLEADFLPGILTHDDYPALIPKGQQIETISVSTVLGVYNWAPDTDRYRKVANFVNTFFSKIDDFHKPPRQPKWRGINLAANVPSMVRFPAAQEWLDKAEAARKAEQRTAGASAIDPALARAQAARAAPANPAEQERLFKEFLEWTRQQRELTMMGDVAFGAAGGQSRRQCAGGTERAPLALNHRPVSGRHPYIGAVMLLVLTSFVAAWPGNAPAQTADTPTVTINVSTLLVVEPGKSLPFPIQVGPQHAIPPRSFVRLDGLPANSIPSEGHMISDAAWAIPLASLPMLMLKVPGPLERANTVRLRLLTIEGNMLAEATTRLTTRELMAATLTQAAPRTEDVEQPPVRLTRNRTADKSAAQASPRQAPAPSVQPRQPDTQPTASQTPTSATAAITARPTAATPPAPQPAPARPQLSPAVYDQAMNDLSRGDAHLKEGNIAVARLFYRRAADLGLADGALALGKTFDPAELYRLGALGTPAEPETARTWYEKAKSLGSSEAARQLARLPR